MQYIFSFWIIALQKVSQNIVKGEKWNLIHTYKRIRFENSLYLCKIGKKFTEKKYQWNIIHDIHESTGEYCVY